MVTGGPWRPTGRPARQDGGVLGFLVVVVGFVFVLIGVNALTTDPPPRPRPPVLGTGSEDPAPTSLAGRRVMGALWTLLGVLFVVAAFTHQVP